MSMVLGPLATPVLEIMLLVVVLSIFLVGVMVVLFNAFRWGLLQVVSRRRELGRTLTPWPAPTTNDLRDSSSKDFPRAP